MAHTAPLDGPTETTNASMRTSTVALIVEQHLGHRTWADNLRAASEATPDLDIRWFPITYRAERSWAARLPVGRQARAVLAARQEMRGLRTTDADVHVFNTQVPAVLGPRRARRVPYVLVTDVTPRQYDRVAAGYGHDPDRPGPLGVVKHRWNRHVIQTARWTVGWSTWVRDSFIADYGTDPARTLVIPPGVDTERWRPGAAGRGDGGRPVQILFVGADFDRKGGHQLLEAYSSLPAGRSTLVVVTKSPVTRAPGMVVIDDMEPNDPRLVELFRRSDVFVLPSLAETFGIAAVEASAAGLPVVASASGGLVDIVADGETGFVVPAGDAAALGSRLRLLLDHPELRSRMGAAARTRALERFDVSMNAERLLDLARACVRSP